MILTSLVRYTVPVKSVYLEKLMNDPRLSWLLSIKRLPSSRKLSADTISTCGYVMYL